MWLRCWGAGSLQAVQLVSTWRDRNCGALTRICVQLGRSRACWRCSMWLRCWGAGSLSAAQQLCSSSLSGFSLAGTAWSWTRTYINLVRSWGAAVPAGWEEVFHVAEVLAGRQPAGSAAALQQACQQCLILRERGLSALLQTLTEVC